MNANVQIAEPQMGAGCTDDDVIYASAQNLAPNTELFLDYGPDFFKDQASQRKPEDVQRDQAEIVPK
ncbi:hypothetical protein V5O48_006665 [Marasmius crinis-equi]|uniref:SET domain-containing protein n=1 Tax=Marasmius crinis-equi TaxID=585013 RepID=A0ABR3FIX4_9AGAR